jgi:hypothetical protein
MNSPRSLNGSLAHPEEKKVGEEGSSTKEERESPARSLDPLSSAPEAPAPASDVPRRRLTQEEMRVRFNMPDLGKTVRRMH